MHGATRATTRVGCCGGSTTSRRPRSAGVRLPTVGGDHKGRLRHRFDTLERLRWHREVVRVRGDLMGLAVSRTNAATKRAG